VIEEYLLFVVDQREKNSAKELIRTLMSFLSIYLHLKWKLIDYGHRNITKFKESILCLKTYCVRLKLKNFLNHGFQQFLSSQLSSLPFLKLPNFSHRLL
jgi:hypothetical protein